MKIKRKFKGGAGKMKIAILNQPQFIDSANTKNKKTDWAELAEECSSISKEIGLTRERSQELLKLARKFLNGCNR